MNRNIVSLFTTAARPRNWSNQELAEFYRVEASLTRVGISVDTEQGLSDEGDPWFVFCRADTHEVIIHFARIDSLYVVASPAFGSCSRGRDFRTLIEGLIEQHPVVVPKDRSKGKLFIHPAALLVALVATCFFKVCQSDAVAGELRDGHSSGPVLGSAGRAFGGTAPQTASQPASLDEQAAAVMIAAIAVAIEWQQTMGLEHSDAGLSAASAMNLGPARSIDISSLVTFHDVVVPVHIVHTAGADASLMPDDAIASPKPMMSTPAHSPDEPQPAPKALADNPIPVAADSVPNIAQAGNLQDPVPPRNVPQTADHGSSGAATSEHGNPATPVQAAAMVEVQAVVGNLLQTHLQSDPQDPEQQFVLSVVNNNAPHTALSTDHQNQAPSEAALPTTQIPTPTVIVADNNQPPASPSVTPAITGLIPASVDSAIQAFMTEHTNFQVIRQGNEVIIYDPALTPSNLPYSQQETFSFSDGSSLMLIGLPAHSSDIGWS